jgi:CspA family cold shock protein
MRSLIVAVASALLLAVVVTEFVQRLWPSSYLALLIITAIALLINGIFNQRMAGKPAAAADPGNRANRNQRKDRNNDSRKKSANNDRANTRDNKNNATSAAPAAASAPSGPREHGEVKWFNRSKGFGFIIRESGDEIFVHQRSIRGADDARSRPVLRDGEAVEFVVTEHDKGLQAEDVVATDRN